jgi:hypothetical protein
VEAILTEPETAPAAVVLAILRYTVVALKVPLAVIVTELA